MRLKENDILPINTLLELIERRKLKARGQDLILLSQAADRIRILDSNFKVISKLLKEQLDGGID